MSDADDDRHSPILSAPAGDGALMAFDVPAFVRRGQDVESLVSSLDDRCRRNRLAMLDMVRMRLRQWEKVATGPADWRSAFIRPIDELWAESGAAPSSWAAAPGSLRQRRAVAKDLKASVERFNTRWLEFVGRMDLELINRSIGDYNRYYLIEKECVMGSSRLAAMHFSPFASVSTDSILIRHPTIFVPQPVGS